jgi:molybdopterin molybdotransferase
VALDEARALGERLAAGLACDALLVSGGVSAGEYDRVAEALERAGMRTLFHGVAVKPGKPILAGRCAGCLVVGLPGNPVSTFTMFAVLVAPALRRLAGLAAWRRSELRARLVRDLAARPGRLSFHLAELSVLDEGLVARPVAATGSGDVLALARANGFVVTSADSRGEPAGRELPAIPWSLAPWPPRRGELRPPVP